MRTSKEISNSIVDEDLVEDDGYIGDSEVDDAENAFGDDYPEEGFSGDEPFVEDSQEGNSEDDLFDDIGGGIPLDEVEDYSLRRPHWGKIVGSVIVCMLFCTLFSFIVYSLYMKHIKYPEKESLVYEESGLYCLENWVSDISELGAGEYISKEIEYANGHEDRINFYKKALSTIKYIPGKTTVKNIYGNNYINKETDDVEYIDSLISEGEEVTLTYVDYTKIEPDKSVVKDLMKEAELKVGDVDYSNKLVDVFCRYMLSLEELPTKSVKYTPNIQKQGNSYVVLPEEDIYLDSLLFSSDEFNDLVYRFSVTAGKATGGKKSKNFQPTKKWKSWDKLSKKKKKKKEEPEKYTYKQLCSFNWCGSYRLETEGILEIPELGDGTLEDPADIGTGIVTNVLKKENGKLKKYPIRVKMIEYGVSDDAVKWFESKDERNRGIDTASEVQYCYYVFEVTNLSGKTITIKDNSSLSDTSANLSTRTGFLYGITDKVKLKPDETGIVESWSKSTELNKKYVIWGKDFKRKENPVWFRVLAGDLEDSTEEKGVKINKTRYGETSEEDLEGDTGTVEEPEGYSDLDGSDIEGGYEEDLSSDPETNTESGTESEE